MRSVVSLLIFCVVCVESTIALFRADRIALMLTSAPTGRRKNSNLVIKNILTKSQKNL